jgi:hypothetical protein
MNITKQGKARQAPFPHQPLAPDAGSLLSSSLGATGRGRIVRATCCLGSQQPRFSLENKAWTIPHIPHCVAQFSPMSWAYLSDKVVLKSSMSRCSCWTSSSFLLITSGFCKSSWVPGCCVAEEESILRALASQLGNTSCGGVIWLGSSWGP